MADQVINKLSEIQIYVKFTNAVTDLAVRGPTTSESKKRIAITKQSQACQETTVHPQENQSQEVA